MNDKKEDKNKISEERKKELSEKYLEADKKAEDNYENQSGLYKGFMVSANLIAHTLVGGAMGYGLDVVFDLSPLFLMIFIALGFVAGMRQIYKESVKES